MFGEENVCVTNAPVPFAPSPKVQEYDNGPVPPVEVAPKLVVSGFTLTALKLAQNAGALHPIVWIECTDWVSARRKSAIETSELSFLRLR